MEMTETMEEKGWFHEALSNVEEILAGEPQNEKANIMKKRIENEIIKQARLVFKGSNDIPSVRHSVASISVDKLQLNPLEGFVFSRIDGRTDVKNLRYVTGMPQDDLYIVLHKFVRMGLIYLDENHQKKSSKGR